MYRAEGRPITKRDAETALERYDGIKKISFLDARVAEFNQLPNRPIILIEFAKFDAHRNLVTVSHFR